MIVMWTINCALIADELLTSFAVVNERAFMMDAISEL